MYFTKVLYEWERSVSDSQLWTEANCTAVIDIPAGEYVLGDTGFANRKTRLVPYRTTIMCKSGCEVTAACKMQKEPTICATQNYAMLSSAYLKS